MTHDESIRAFERRFEDEYLDCPWDCGCEDCVESRALRSLSAARKRTAIPMPVARDGDADAQPLTNGNHQ